MNKEKTIIIGAGISGLTYAYFTKSPYEVLESKDYPGGLCTSFYENGYTFDCSGHFIHIKDKKVKTFVDKLTQGTDEITRKASIFFKDDFIPYPFQANLYYLDPKTKKECTDGILNRKNIKINPKMPFIDWSEAMFGKGITKHFMKPYNSKLWSYDLNRMTAEWTGPFVPRPDAETIIRSAYSKDKKDYGYNSVFYYPKIGGCKALIDGLLKKVKVSLNSKVSKIDLKSKNLFSSNGKEYKFNRIISTQPLPELIDQIQDIPVSIKNASQKLIHNSVRCINIGIRSKNGIPKILKDRHWIYIPEKNFSFYRLGIYSNVNKNSAPENCYSFYIEFSSLNGKYKNSENIIEDLKKTGFIRKNDKIEAVNIIDMPYAYIIFDKNRERSLKTINTFLNKNNIYSIGRYGAWEYSFIEKNIIDAQKLAEKLNK